MSFNPALAKFSDIHPQLRSACWSVAREITQSRNPQIKYKDLMQALWAHLDALTQTLYQEPSSGNSVDPKGLLLHRTAQQTLLEAAVQKVAAGINVKVPHIEGTRQLLLTEIGKTSHTRDDIHERSLTNGVGAVASPQTAAGLPTTARSGANRNAKLRALTTPVTPTIRLLLR
jgi:hypothetical protein